MSGTVFKMQNEDKGKILLYIPNLLGYLRIVLAFLSLKYFMVNPDRNVDILVVSALLDAIDGPLARKLNQCSKIGALIDIVADNAWRTITWIQAMIITANSGYPIFIFVGCFIICTEWLVMHALLVSASNSIHWKDKCSSSQQNSLIIRLKQEFFRNNFKNPIGSLGLYGLFFCGLGTYCHFQVLPPRLTLFGLLPEFLIISYNCHLLYAAYIGRFITFLIEIDTLKDFVSNILIQE